MTKSEGYENKASINQTRSDQCYSTISNSSIAFLGKRITREYKSSFILPDENIVSVIHREVFRPDDGSIEVMVNVTSSDFSNRYCSCRMTTKTLVVRDFIEKDTWAQAMLTASESKDAQLLGYLCYDNTYSQKHLSSNQKQNQKVEKIIINLERGSIENDNNKKINASRNKTHDLRIIVNNDKTNTERKLETTNNGESKLAHLSRNLNFFPPIANNDKFLESSVDAKIYDDNHRIHNDSILCDPSIERGEKYKFEDMINNIRIRQVLQTNDKTDAQILSETAVNSKEIRLENNFHFPSRDCSSGNSSPRKELRSSHRLFEFDNDRFNVVDEEILQVINPFKDSEEFSHGKYSNCEESLANKKIIDNSPDYSLHDRFYMYGPKSQTKRSFISCFDPRSDLKSGSSTKKLDNSSTNNMVVIKKLKFENEEHDPMSLRNKTINLPNEIISAQFGEISESKLNERDTSQNYQFLNCSTQRTTNERGEKLDFRFQKLPELRIDQDLDSFSPLDPNKLKPDVFNVHRISLPKHNSIVQCAEKSLLVASEMCNSDRKNSQLCYDERKNQQKYMLNDVDKQPIKQVNILEKFPQGDIFLTDDANPITQTDKFLGYKTSKAKKNFHLEDNFSKRQSNMFEGLSSIDNKFTNMFEGLSSIDNKFNQEQDISDCILNSDNMKELIVSTKRRTTSGFIRNKNTPKVSSSTNDLWFGNHPVPTRSRSNGYLNSKYSLKNTNRIVPLRYSNIQLQAQAELLRRREMKAKSLDYSQIKDSSGLTLPEHVSMMDLSVVDPNARQYCGNSRKKISGGAPQYERDLARRFRHKDGYETLSKVFLPPSQHNESVVTNIDSRKFKLTRNANISSNLTDSIVIFATTDFTEKSEV